uniref:C2 domain-containing protein n=1 Tax=Aegilops tauschii subsp. strangulata TaxID=200361 RepID=A0A453AR17_AEGTS
MAYRVLEVTLLSAKDLKSVNLITRMEVYAVATISGDPITRQCTPPDPHGGRNPTWNATLQFAVPPTAEEATGGCLHILLRVERIFGGDRDVGEVIVPLSEILSGVGHGADYGAHSMPQFASYQIRKVHRTEVRGLLYLTYRLGPIVLPEPHLEIPVDEWPVVAYPVKQVMPPPPPPPQAAWPGYVAAAPPAKPPAGYVAVPPAKPAGYLDVPFSPERAPGHTAWPAPPKPPVPSPAKQEGHAAVPPSPKPSWYGTAPSPAKQEGHAAVPPSPKPSGYGTAPSPAKQEGHVAVPPSPNPSVHAVPPSPKPVTNVAVPPSPKPSGGHVSMPPSPAPYGQVVSMPPSPAPYGQVVSMPPAPKPAAPVVVSPPPKPANLPADHNPSMEFGWGLGAGLVSGAISGMLAGGNKGEPTAYAPQVAPLARSRQVSVSKTYGRDVYTH